MPLRTTASLATALFLSTFATPASAQAGGQYGAPPPQYGAPQYGAPQYGAPPPQYGAPQYGAPPPQYGAPQYGGYGYAPPQRTSRPKSTPLEVGYLYVTSAAWGVGTGIWIDAVAGVDDPGLRLIAPAILGVAAPVGVFFLDSPPMPRGLPSAIATGMLVGAGEGLGIASYQYVSAAKADEWSFTGFATSEVIGATAGGVGGAAFYYLLRPKPQSNLFIASGAFWGTVIGSEFGAGASNGDFGATNDTVSVGGLIGFNVALAASLGVSAAWTPSWNQISWMWGGLAIGTLASLPVYIFYAGSDYDPRRGLIFQGVAGLLGIGAGAFIGKPDPRGDVAEDAPTDGGRPPFARLLGASLVPHEGGFGASFYGELW